MKTFALLLCLIATTADTAPLYLKCDGKQYSRDPRTQNWLRIQSRSTERPCGSRTG